MYICPSPSKQDWESLLLRIYASIDFWLDRNIGSPQYVWVSKHPKAMKLDHIFEAVVRYIQSPIFVKFCPLLDFRIRKNHGTCGYFENSISFDEDTTKRSKFLADSIVLVRIHKIFWQKPFLGTLFMIKELGLGQQRRVYFLTEGLSSLLTSNRDEINNFAKHTSALALSTPSVQEVGQLNWLEEGWSQWSLYHC